LEVDKSTSFVNNPDVRDAVVSTVMNITAIPEEFLTIDLQAVSTRRLQFDMETASSSTSGKVVVTYAGSVQGDSQPTPTGKEVAEALMSTTAEDFAKTLSNTIEAIADSAFVLDVVEKSDVSLTVLESSSTSTTTSTFDANLQTTVTQTSTKLAHGSSTSFLASTTPVDMEAPDPDRDVAAKFAVFSAAQCLAVTSVLLLL